MFFKGVHMRDIILYEGCTFEYSSRQLKTGDQLADQLHSAKTISWPRPPPVPSCGSAQAVALKVLAVVLALGSEERYARVVANWGRLREAVSSAVQRPLPAPLVKALGVLATLAQVREVPLSACIRAPDTAPV